MLLIISGVSVEVAGLNNLEKKKNYIFISNHSSLFDIPIVLAKIPSDIRIVAKKELTKIPIFGYALKFGGFIIIDRQQSIKAMKSIELAAEKIKKGLSVLLFAEGTRSKDGNIQPFKRGAFLLASKTGIPIIPLTIKGSSNIMPKSRLKIKGGMVKLILDSPIDTDKIKGKKDELHLMENVRNIIVNNYSK